MKKISRLLNTIPILAAMLITISAMIFLLNSCKSIAAPGLNNQNPDISADSNIETSGDEQIIEVTASGGYSPRTINARAGIPTILRMKSDGAYGCERSFRIPKLGIQEMLPTDGNTDFDLGIQDKGTTLVGVCSMGMYSFKIIFN